MKEMFRMIDSMIESVKMQLNNLLNHS